MFRSPAGGDMRERREVIDEMFQKILLRKDSEWSIAIGTDSQNFKDTTKFCSAILLLEKGKGGIYFYELTRESRHMVLQSRMMREAEISIALGKEIINLIEDKLLSDELIEEDLKLSFEIHCDFGKYGKSKDSIGAAIGWITSEFGDSVETKVKPDSVAASSIADKYTR